MTDYLRDWLTEYDAHQACDRYPTLYRITDFDAKKTPQGYRFRVKREIARRLIDAQSQPTLFD